MHKTSFEKVELSPFVTKIKRISFGILLSIFVLLLLPWEQTTRGGGILIAYDPTQRDYTIGAPVSGFVKEYFIEEDKPVKEGDLLVEMQDLDSEFLPRLKDISNDVKIEQVNMHNSLSLLYEQENNLKENLAIGVEIFDRKIAQIEDSLITLANKEKEVSNNFIITKTNYERIKTLFNEGIESMRSYELAHNEYIKLSNDLDTTRVNIEREKKALEIEKREKMRFLKTQENSINTMQERIITSQNRLKTLDKEFTNANIDISRNTNARLYAVKDGTPVRILINDKDRFIRAGEPLIHFAPKVSQKVLLLKIRALDMPLIQVGLKTRVQFHGWPAMQVSGWPRITFGTFGGIVDKIDPISHEAGFFYAYIKEDPADPWPDNEVLKIGTDATAWVRLSIVRIGYEMWRLYSALPARIVNPKEK